MRFEPDSPIDRLIQTIPHLAFEVDDVESEIAKHTLDVLTEPNTPSPGVTVAMIIHDGALIELISYELISCSILPWNAVKHFVHNVDKTRKTSVDHHLLKSMCTSP
jgi:hypothetical protein